jgi:hypothetical protein
MNSKRIIVTIVGALLAVTSLSAQDFKVGDRLTDGGFEWTVQEIRMGTYVYLTTDQFDELTLEKVKGKSGTYKLVPSRQAEDPIYGNEFGCPAVFMREDGNLILAFLDSKGNKVDALRPQVERKDYTFKVEFLPVPGQPVMYDHIVVKGSAGSSFAPEFETELELAQTFDADDSRLTNLQWVNDEIDLNFDGIPDLLIYLGTTAVRGAPSAQYGYVWNDDEGCFESVREQPFLELDVNPQTKTLTSTYSNGPDEDVEETYFWKDGKLRRVGEADPVDLTGQWYNGTLVYTASKSDDGHFTMNAMSEGEEHEFWLIPVHSDDHSFSLTDGTSRFVNEYAEQVGRVVYRAQDGYQVLCIYEGDGTLIDVMSRTEDGDAQNHNVENWMPQICGKYQADNGSSVVLAYDHVLIDGMRLPLKAVTFNGEVIDIVEVGKEGSPVHTSFELKPTVAGLKAIEVAYDEEAYWYKPTGKEYDLVWNDKAKSRFDFASNVLLNDRLYRYDKPTLRLMRNAILARHGYVFQSKDLKEYFGNQAWYKPAASNAGITLSFLEQLNVDLIKAAEK